MKQRCAISLPLARVWSDWGVDKVILLYGEFLDVEDNGLTFLGVVDEFGFDSFGVEDDVEGSQLLLHESEWDFHYHPQWNHCPPTFWTSWASLDPVVHDLYDIYMSS